MNIAVGIISDEARVAIEAAGGRIEATKQTDVSMVILPDAEITSSGDYAHIALPDPSPHTLFFVRAWHTKDCRLDLCK